MPVSDEYLDFVLDQLRTFGEVLSKRMFGGVGLYHDTFFFGLIASDALYLKVDDINKPDYEKAGSKPFQPYGEDSFSMSYYAVPADVLENADKLSRWANDAVAAARRKSSSPKRSVRPRPKRKTNGPKRRS